MMMMMMMMMMKRVSHNIKAIRTIGNKWNCEWKV